ncbi:hypothetical protein FHT08_000060 [Xanthomonas campestris]|nr:hypothetical protein [Xanthomonas sp. CFBP 8151]
MIDRKMQRGAEFTSPAAVKEYLRTKLAGFEHEVFALLFMDLCGCLRNVQRAGEALAPQAFPALSLHITDLTAAATIQ